MKTVIFLNGNINDYDYCKSVIQADDYIICADGGYKHAVKLGVSPDIVIGDMDSVNMSVAGLNTVLYPKEKDATDGEIAVRHAIEHGKGSDILILGGIGSRFDHTLCNALLLKIISDAGKNGKMSDENNDIYITSSKITLSGKPGDIVSFIPVSGTARGVSVSNMKYPLSKFDACLGTSRGISNVMLTNVCSISVDDGLLFIIKTSDNK